MSPTSDEVASAPSTCDLLVSGSRVYTGGVRSTCHAPGAVAVIGDRIAAVGPEKEVRARFIARENIETLGIIHPGFVEAHYHATLHPLRYLLEAGTPSAAAEKIVAWYNLLDDESEYIFAREAASQLLRLGYTTLVEAGTALEPDSVATAAREVGLRVSLTDPFLWDTNSGANPFAGRIRRAPVSRDHALARLGEQASRCIGKEGLVHGHVGLYGGGTASLELSLAAKEVADGLGSVLCQHQSLDLRHAQLDDVRFGGEPVLDLFARIGFLGTNVTLVHMNAIREQEVAAVVSSGVTLVWQPANAIYYGVARNIPNRIPALAAAGVPLALGTDVTKAWTFADPPLLAYLESRAGGWPIEPETLLTIQTWGGARACGLTNLTGCIEVGKKADFVVREQLDSYADDPLHHLLLLARGRNVVHVVVDGRIVLRNGSLETHDHRAVSAAATGAARRLFPLL